MKGITLPARVVMKHYLDQWGPGPHKLGLTTHVHSVQRKQGQKNWLMQFKKKWRLEVGALPHRPGLQPDEIKDKAVKKNSFQNHFCKASEQIFVRNLDESQVPVWEPLLVPNLYPTLVPSIMFCLSQVTIRTNFGTIFGSQK